MSSARPRSQDASASQNQDEIVDAVVVTDRDGAARYWNRDAAGLICAAPSTEAPTDWLTGLGLTDTRTGEALSAAELPLSRALRGEAPDPVEASLPAAPGRRGRCVRVMARALLDGDGRIAGSLVRFANLVEQQYIRSLLDAERAALAAERRLEAQRREALAATIHQLSQPITALDNYTEALVALHAGRRLDDSRLDDLLGRLRALSQETRKNLARLRADVGPNHEDASPLDINALIDDCLAAVLGTDSDLDLRAQRDYAPDLPPVFARPRGVASVLVRLAGAAIDTAPQAAPVRPCLAIRTRLLAQADLIRVELTAPRLREDLIAELIAAHRGGIRIDRIDGGDERRTGVRMHLPVEPERST